MGEEKETNKFGDEIPSIQEIVEDEDTEHYIWDTLAGVLRKLGWSKPCYQTEQLMKAAHSAVPVTSYEHVAHDMLEDVEFNIAQALSGRADVIFEQIRPYIDGKVLDLGCGDGQVGARIAQEGLEVHLADVYRHANIDNTGLHFIPLNQGEPADIQEQYDTTLLLTVLHHADNPLQVIRDARRMTRPGGNIIVIESVYGIDDDTAFGKLSHEEQRLSNIFFDHFYNRILHYSKDLAKKVPVPFNFSTPEGWKKMFEDNGLKQTELVHLGIDQPAVPEYHTLHVLEVE